MQIAEKSQAGGLFTLAELIVEQELCINLRGRLMHCTACDDVCPAGAITLSPDSVDVDGVLCTGCNNCLPRCPAGALRSTGFIPERLLQALIAGLPTHLHCRASEEEGGGMVIPCFGVLDARLLAAVRGEGVSELRLHGLEHCEGCRYGDAREHIDSLVSQLDRWLGTDAPSLDLHPETAEERHDGQRDYQDQPHMDRRTFLRFGGARSVSKAAEWLVPGMLLEEEDEEALPFFQTNDYPQRAAAYQQALVTRVDQVPWHNEGTLPFTMRRVNEHCSACLCCGERCPTGALKGSETPRTRTLSFDPAACTDCKLCERICPEHAMIQEPLRDIAALDAGPQTLLFSRQQSCRQCGTAFLPSAAESDTCPVCSNEQALDEAWLDMLFG